MDLEAFVYDDTGNFIFVHGSRLVVNYKILVSRKGAKNAKYIFAALAGFA